MLCPIYCSLLGVLGVVEVLSYFLGPTPPPAWTMHCLAKVPSAGPNNNQQVTLKFFPRDIFEADRFRVMKRDDGWWLMSFWHWQRIAVLAMLEINYGSFHVWLLNFLPTTPHRRHTTSTGARETWQLMDSVRLEGNCENLLLKKHFLIQVHAWGEYLWAQALMWSAFGCIFARFHEYYITEIFFSDSDFVFSEKNSKCNRWSTGKLL